MCQRIQYPLGIAFAVLLLMAIPSAGMSQSIWLPPSEGHSVSLEVFKVDWVANRNETFASSVSFLTVRHQSSSSITIVGELPLSHFDRKSNGFFNPKAETVVGNPYLGILFNPENSSLISEFGFRIPITSDKNPFASIIGAFTDFDRSEAFVPDAVSARARFGGKVVSRSGIVHARFLGGGMLLIPTDDDDAEVFADAVGQFWFQDDQFMFGATMSIRSSLSEADLSFKERSEIQLGFDANGTFGNVRPGLHVHIPIADRRSVDAIFGVNFTFLLGEPKRYDDWE